MHTRKKHRHSQKDAIIEAHGEHLSPLERKALIAEAHRMLGHNNKDIGECGSWVRGKRFMASLITGFHRKRVKGILGVLFKVTVTIWRHALRTRNLLQNHIQRIVQVTMVVRPTGVAFPAMNPAN